MIAIDSRPHFPKLFRQIRLSKHVDRMLRVLRQEGCLNDILLLDSIDLFKDRYDPRDIRYQSLIFLVWTAQAFKL